MVGRAYETVHGEGANGAIPVFPTKSFTTPNQAWRDEVSIEVLGR